MQNQKTIRKSGKRLFSFRQRARSTLLFMSLAAWSGLTGCSAIERLPLAEQVRDPAGAGAPSAFNPQGPAAAQISTLWWLMFGLGTIVYIIVMIYLAMAITRKRNQGEDLRNPDREKRIVVWGGAIFPTVILLVVFGFTIGTLWSIASPSREAEVTIFVKGYQWWWDVTYPDLQVRTANEIHIPAGKRVEIQLTSHDVIHSFWVPQLHGKLDANPGRVTTFHIEADEPGVYWGECAEFCGVQHAQMRFLVVAEPEEDFERWVQTMSAPAAVPASGLAKDGWDVFLRSNCMYCHTVRGTNATGELGPDLTHLASRRILAAGATENSVGNLGGWIADPHSIKPGVLMPASDLTGPELQALIAFLETLK